MNIPKRPVFTINKSSIFALLFGILLAASCQEAPVSDHISLVFQKQNPSKHEHISISYLDDFLIPHVEYPQPGSYLKLHNTSRTYVDVRYKEINKTSRNYLFRLGDSVFFDTREKWPKVKVVNRESGTVNFENDMYAYFYHDKPTPVEDFYYYWNMMNNPVGQMSGIDMSNEINGLKDRAFKYLGLERFYIDSLSQLGKLDEMETRFYLMKNEIVQDRLSLYSGDSTDFTNRQVVAAAFNLDQKIDTLLKPQYFITYNDLITQYYEDYLSHKMPSNPSDVTIIDDLDFLPEEVRNILVNKHINYQLKSMTPGEGLALVENLENQVLYKEKWNEHFKDKYYLTQQFDRRWRLQDAHGEYLVFDDLLRRNKGKLIYLDFWAGWCQPCIKELPNSHQLSMEYEGEVAFVYLSLDPNFSSWQKSSSRFLTHNPSESYYLDSLNSKRASKEFEVTSIPRYMLFDTNGDLILQYAPRPGTEAIRSILNSLMEEDI